MSSSPPHPLEALNESPASQADGGDAIASARWLWWVFGIGGVVALVAGLVPWFMRAYPLWGVHSPNLQVAAIHYPHELEPLLRAGHDPNALFDKLTPLAWAVRFDKVQSVAILLDHGADPNSVGADGESSLNHLWHFHDLRDIDMLYLALDHGASPDVVSWNGNPWIWIAAQEGNRRVLQRLLKAGADPDSLDDFHQSTALHNAAAAGRADLVRDLLAAGASVDLVDRNNRTPLLAGLQHRAVVELLIEASLDVESSGGRERLLRAAQGETREFLESRFRDQDAAREAAPQVKEPDLEPTATTNH